MTAPAAAVDLGPDTDFFGDVRAKPAPWSIAWFRRLAFYSLVGTVLLFANFPKFLTRTIEVNVADLAWRDALLLPVQAVQLGMAGAFGARPVEFFERTMTWAFLLLLLFGSSMLLFCIRRRSPRMLVYTAGGVVVGYFVLHLIAWAAVAIVVAVGGALYVGRWVSSGIATVIGFLLPYLGLLLAIAATVGAYILRGHLWSALRQLAHLLRPYAARVLGVSLLIVVLAFVVPPFYRWVIEPVIAFLRNLLAPIGRLILTIGYWLLTAVITVVVVVVAAAVGVLSLAVLGSLLVSQLQAGWHAARSVRHALIAGFAIGSSLGLIALVSIATPAVAEALNAGWQDVFVIGGVSEPGSTTSMVTGVFHLLLPRSVEAFVFTHLTTLQAPALDGLVLVTVMTLASTSMLLRLFSSQAARTEEISVSFVAQEFGKMALGSFVAVLLIFLAAASGDSEA